MKKQAKISKTEKVPTKKINGASVFLAENVMLGGPNHRSLSGGVK